MQLIQRQRRNRAIGGAFALALSAAGCGGGGSSPASPPPPGNHAPAFTSSSNRNVPENSATFGAVVATDADGDPVTLALTGGADASRVTFNPATGAISLRTCGLDFESPSDANADNTFELTLSASDGTAATVQQLRVTVTNAVEPTIGNGLVIQFDTAGPDAGSFGLGGDIDCDGFPEMLVTPGFYPDPAVAIANDVYVLLGDDLRKKSNTSIELPRDIGNGIHIRGAEKYAPDGRSAGFIGDVDGDGRGDLFVQSSATQQIYVVFGDTLLDAYSGGKLIDLDSMALGEDGIVINGMNGNATGIGDVDGDGLHDLAFGNVFAPSYVVFGSALKSERTKDGIITATALPGSGEGVELSTVNRSISFTYTPMTMAPAGDVDGDGLADLAIGLPTSNAAGLTSGEAFVVLGSAMKAAAATPSGAIDLTQIQIWLQGMRVGGVDSSITGWSVAGLGRIDSDNKGEILVGAPYWDMSGRTDAGQVALIRGSRLMASMPALSHIDWPSLATDGSTLLITGAEDSARAGFAAGPAGDVDGDGVLDLMVGAPMTSNGTMSPAAGAVHVLFGSGLQGRLSLDLAAIPSSSVAVKIEAASDTSYAGQFRYMFHMGGLLEPLGDLDGDGLDEIAVGQWPEQAFYSTTDRSGIFIISGARLAQAKANGGPIRLRDMLP